MSKTKVEYLVFTHNNPFFFINPKGEFRDFPSDGDIAEEVVVQDGLVISRKFVVFDQVNGWLQKDGMS